MHITIYFTKIIVIINQHVTVCYNMRIYNILYFYISMFCTDTCHKQPLGEVLHSMEICFVTSLLKYLSLCFPQVRSLFFLLMGKALLNMHII